MGGPADGEYLIVATAVPSPPVGVNNKHEAVVPVVSGGANNAFLVKELEDGKYYLHTQGGVGVIARDIVAEGDRVVGLGPFVQQTGLWNISGEDGGPYVISQVTDRVGAITCWVLERGGPDQPVVLKNYPVYPGVELPEWNFIPGN